MEEKKKVKVLPTGQTAVAIVEKKSLARIRKKEMKKKKEQIIAANPFLIFEINQPRNLLVKFSSRVWFTDLNLFEQRIKDITQWNVYKRKDFANIYKSGWFIFKSRLGSDWDSCSFIDLVFRNKDLFLRLKVMQDEITLCDLRIGEKQLLCFEYDDFFMFRKGRKNNPLDFDRWLLDVRNVAVNLFAEIFKTNKMTVAPGRIIGADIIGKGFSYYIGKGDMFSSR